MKPVTVKITINGETETFSDAKSENPLRALEQAREWLKAQHIPLASERDRERVADHLKTQAAIARKLGRTEIADAIAAGDGAKVQQLEAARIARLGEIDDARNLKPEPVRVKARSR